MATDVTCLQCGKPYDASVVENRFAGVCPACLVNFAADDSGEVEPSPGIADPAMKPPLKLGGTFHGLEVVELLGAGGMGVVYKARQPGLDRLVALKVLSPKLSTDPEFVTRFNREAKAMAALSHPGIVQVFDFGKEAGLCFLVMEFVDGLTLRQLMKDRLLAPEQALKIVPKICEALDFAHSKGVIHRDIKPENILVDKEGRVRIADFGLARMLSSEAAGSPVTLSRVVMGTPGYMAPEQYQGMKVDHRADIYSLGAVFYEMLTGDLPIGRFEPPSNKVQIDVRLDEIVLKALATQPDRRYQRAGDVKTAMDTVSSHPAPVVAVPESPPDPNLGRRIIRVLVGIPVTLLTIAGLCYVVALMLQGGLIHILLGIPLIIGIVIWFRRLRVSSAAWAGIPFGSKGPGSAVAKPRMIPLAVASFIVVVAGVAATAVSLFGIPEHEERLRHGVLIGGLFVQMMGLFMSLGAMRLIRISKVSVRGSGFALAAFLNAIVCGGTFFVATMVQPPRDLKSPEAKSPERPSRLFWEVVGLAPPEEWFRGIPGWIMPATEGDQSELIRWIAKPQGFFEESLRHFKVMAMREDKEQEGTGRIITWFAELATGSDPGRVLTMKRPMPGEANLVRNRILVGIYCPEHPKGRELIQRLAKYYSEEIERLERGQ